MLSQDELAEAVGVSGFTVYRWEHGEEPVGVRPKTARRLSEVLGAKPGELLAEEELSPLVPAPTVQLAAMYAADAATRRKALAETTDEERASYLSELDSAIERAEAALIDDAASAASSSDEDGERAYAGRRSVLRRYIGRLVALRDEAAGVDSTPPPQEEVAEIIAHAGAGASA
jgi:transcriptional regulator with XRE-family HTH domain